MKIIKARCAKYNKWFKIAVGDGGEIVNFEGISVEAAKACQTQVSETRFFTAQSLRPCRQCGSRHVGKCDHVENCGLCRQPYFFQCLYCSQLRISREAASSRFSEFVGQSNIVGAELDKFGNPLGEKYDLAKRDGFKGFRIVILSTNLAFNRTSEAGQKLRQGPVDALTEKGFEVVVISPDDRSYFTSGNHVNAQKLRTLLGPRTQLWIISYSERGFDATTAGIVEEFYKAGGGLYLWGDNDPLHADADFIGQRLFGVGMRGDYQGDKVLGVLEKGSSCGIVPGHPISTGIAHFYEGITIAAVRTNSQVLPLVYSSDGNVVTAYSESFGSRLLFDGGFTRLWYKWDTAGTGRFVTNCAAWLANDDNGGGGEVSFT
ncbi:MAG: hypothetical protein IJH78_06220 [Clostridia bacterium]|nr:hypothetical protein [Clostridia bacterium]